MNRRLTQIFVVVLTLLLWHTASAGQSPEAAPETWEVTFENGNDAKLFADAAAYLSTCNCVVMNTLFIRGYRTGELRLTLTEGAASEQ